jgi:FMN reductase
MKTLIISTSLNEYSKSQVMAEKFLTQLQSLDEDVSLIDLRELPIPLCGSNKTWENENVAKLNEAIVAATHIVFAVPIYCYDVNAACKNVIEYTGRAFTNKVVSFICAAGGANSFMSVMGFANHLMLDFRSVIVPRFVYAQKSDWSEDGQLNSEVEERLVLLGQDMKQISVNLA